MPSLLPPLKFDWSAEARLEQTLMPQKFAQAMDPAKYGVRLNTESLNYLAAVDAGFVPATLTGWETWTAWGSVGQSSRVKAGLYDLDAWRSKQNGVSYASAYSQAKSNAGAFGVDQGAWLAAVDRIYGGGGQTGVITDWMGRSYYPGDYTNYVVDPDGTKHLTLKNGNILTWGTGAGGKTPVARKYRQFLQVIYKDAEFTPNVGMRVPPSSLAWREIQQEMGPDGVNVINPLVAFGKWVSWKGGFIGSTGGPTGNEPIQAWNINTVPNSDMLLANWDMPGLLAAVQSSSSTAPSMSWTAIKHSGNLGPQAKPLPPPPPTPHADPNTAVIPPGVPAVAGPNGLVPDVVALNTPIVDANDGSVSGNPLPNPADGLARFSQGLGLVIVGLVGWFLWNKRR